MTDLNEHLVGPLCKLEILPVERESSETPATPALLQNRRYSVEHPTPLPATVRGGPMNPKGYRIIVNGQGLVGAALQGYLNPGHLRVSEGINSNHPLTIRLDLKIGPIHVRPPYGVATFDGSFFNRRSEQPPPSFLEVQRITDLVVADLRIRQKLFLRADKRADLESDRAEIFNQVNDPAITTPDWKRYYNFLWVGAQIEIDGAIESGAKPYRPGRPPGRKNKISPELIQLQERVSAVEARLREFIERAEWRRE